MSIGLVIFLTVLVVFLILLMGFNVFLIIRSNGIMSASIEIIDQTNQFLADFMQQQREAMSMMDEDEDNPEGRISLNG